ncbi:hypothetical protein H012_gp889 [Acanthamoeba polyphaga moumouvirus]|uniref:Uncharacterized protein n=2 Tax=Moumouvirus TaxID=3080801 RepID=L7RBN7_9VIRU|nr:hypothetical protein H012_gp889 [Acanthamoeba polyphaga moumouvirus]AEX63298.1 hypothetical protein mv_R1096 [Moumouvirus Monve]AGC01577.1 hypothetical protein Moumou_00029 [Acanthamoeba polyphaga moumouvirus]AQN67902.1 hypothetical protein [Saudi moumouvirus]
MNSLTGYKKVLCFRIVKDGEKDYGSIIDDYDNTSIILSSEKLSVATVKTPPASEIIYLDRELRSPRLYVEEIKNFNNKTIDDNYRCYANGYRFIVGKTTYSESRINPGIHFDLTVDQAKKDKYYY